MYGPPKGKWRLKGGGSTIIRRRHSRLLLKGVAFGEDLKDKEDLLDRGNSPRKGIEGMKSGCGKTEGTSRKREVHLGCSVG